MSHPVYPSFPASPTIGQVYTDVNGAIWTFGSTGWAKTKIVLTSDYPIYEGLLVEDKP